MSTDGGDDSKHSKQVELAERKAYDADVIEDYAWFLAHRHIRRVTEAGASTIPDKDEVYKQTIWALHSFYDNSSTLYHLHTKVRTSNDPQELQLFLDMLPETIMRDMSVSAMAEEDRQVKKRKALVKALDYAIKRQEQTAEATLHLLRRLGEGDEEVEYVKALVGDSLREVRERRKGCEDARVLERGS